MWGWLRRRRVQQPAARPTSRERDAAAQLRAAQREAARTAAVSARMERLSAEVRRVLGIEE